MTPFWYNNISILYNKRYLFEIFPHRNFDLNRKLNSLLRLSLYYSLIIFIMKKDKNIFYIPLITGILTFFINKKYSKTQVNEAIVGTLNGSTDTENIKKLEGSCRVPNKENPFMNINFTEYGRNKEIKTSCDSYNNKGIQRVIEKNFNEDLYRDPNDIFGKNNSQRQFFNMPNSGYNDQNKFAEWLYSTPPTCKEGNGLQCSSNKY